MNQRIVLGLVAGIVLGLGLMVWANQTPTSTPSVAELPQKPPAPTTPWTTTVLEPLGPLKFSLLEPGDGTNKPGDDQVVDISFIGWDAASEQKVASADHERVKIGAADWIEGLQLAVRNLEPGGIAQIEVPPELAFGQTGRPPLIKRDATLIYELQLHRILQERAVLDAPPPGAPDSEHAGIPYLVLEPGAGEPPQIGDPVSIHFTTWRNGTLLHSSRTAHRPVRVKAGSGELLPALDPIVATLRPGEWRKVVSNGADDTLVFEVERLTDE